jgi:hypothetical protein
VEEAQEKLHFDATERSQHDSLVAPGTEPGKRLRAAVLYKYYNTPFVDQLRPQQPDSVEQLHLMRLHTLRAVMGSYKQREKWRLKYNQRPIKVDFGPVPKASPSLPRRMRSAAPAVAEADPKDAWIRPFLEQVLSVATLPPRAPLSSYSLPAHSCGVIAPLIYAQMKFNLSHSSSPWPIGKQEEFLRTARQQLYFHFNHAKLARFTHLRPLPPTIEQLRAGPQAEGEQQAQPQQ